jgi:hypothetical protein
MGDMEKDARGVWETEGAMREAANRGGYLFPWTMNSWSRWAMISRECSMSFWVCSTWRRISSHSPLDSWISSHELVSWFSTSGSMALSPKVALANAVEESSFRSQK